MELLKLASSSRSSLDRGLNADRSVSHSGGVVNNSKMHVMTAVSSVSRAMICGSCIFEATVVDKLRPVFCSLYGDSNVGNSHRVTAAAESKPQVVNIPSCASPVKSCRANAR